MKLTKKGFSLTEVPQLVIILFVIAIILGVGATVLTNVRDADVPGSSSAFYSNYSRVIIKGTAYDISPAALDYDTLGKPYLITCSDVKVANKTRTEDITSKFTISGCTATYSGAGVTHNNTNVKFNFTYTYYTYGNSYNRTQEGINSTVSFASWQTVWVIIVAAAIVLGLIYRYMVL